MIKQRRRRLTAERKAELWKRWKAGQSLHEIGRALGKDHVVIHLSLARHGGIAPAPPSPLAARADIWAERSSRGTASTASQSRLFSLWWNRRLAQGAFVNVRRARNQNEPRRDLSSLCRKPSSASLRSSISRFTPIQIQQSSMARTKRSENGRMAQPSWIILTRL
jgi:hypothetical protein